jgi:hypothetical protein
MNAHEIWGLVFLIPGILMFIVGVLGISVAEEMSKAQAACILSLMLSLIFIVTGCVLIGNGYWMPGGLGEQYG